MPKAFENCVKRKGKVKTIKIDEKRYMHICYLRGIAYPGETKTKKK